MKKNLILGCAAVLMMSVLASCDELKNSGSGENGGISVNGPDGPETTVLQPDEQKVKLQNVGQEIMDLCPSEDLQYLADLAEKFSNSIYNSEEYDWGSLEDWSEEAYESSYKEDKNITFKNGIYTNESIIGLTILMADHTGLFTLTEDGVVISEYPNGTKAVVELDGKKYEAEITSSGKVTEAYYVYESYSEHPGYGYEDENYNWVETEDMIIKKYTDKISFKVGVPEKINISLKEDGKSLANVAMTLTPSFSKDGVKLTTDGFSTSVNIALEGGYEVIIEKAAYNGASGTAGYSRTIKKDGTVIISTKASAEVRLKEVTEEGMDPWGDGQYDKYSYTYIAADKVKNITASVDIMGQIQVYATCSNAIEASEALDNMRDALRDYDYETGESKIPDVDSAERYLNNFNAKIDCGVYYDGGSNKQADIVFELDSYTEEAYWDRNGDGIVNNNDSYTYYDLIPVIVFDDGSRYLAEDFFTEDAFEDIINAFDEFCTSYDDMLGFLEEEPESNVDMGYGEYSK